MPNVRTKEELLEWIVKTASAIWDKEVSGKPDGMLTPVFFGVPDDPMEPTMIIPAQWSNEDEKVAMLDLLRNLFKEKGITMYGHVSEAWTSVIEAENIDRRRLPPSQDPNRQEHVIFFVAEKGGETIFKRRLIQRHPDGTASLGPLEDMADAGFKGRMTELLDEEVDNFSSPVTVH